MRPPRPGGKPGQARPPSVDILELPGQVGRGYLVDMQTTLGHDLTRRVVDDFHDHAADHLLAELRRVHQRGEDLARTADWIRPITDSELEELDAALRNVRRRGLDWPEMTRDDFPIPRLANYLRSPKIVRFMTGPSNFAASFVVTPASRLPGCC